jgi:hypothetical protein
VPNFWGHDEVPDEVKAQPRLLEVPPPSTEEKDWPRLGDVPFKPKDFSPKPAYDQEMNELEQDRSEAETAKKNALESAPVSGNAAVQDDQDSISIQPPQFLKK